MRRGWGGIVELFLLPLRTYMALLAAAAKSLTGGGQLK